MFLTEREEGERRARGVRIEGASRGEERTECIIMLLT
jgi:hypothetical protein